MEYLAHNFFLFFFAVVGLTFIINKSDLRLKLFPCKSTGIIKWLHELTGCSLCTGIWVSGILYTIILFIPVTASQFILYAFSGGAISYIIAKHLKI